MSPLLEVHDLTVTFPTDTDSVAAVRGLSYQVAAGEVVAIVGESGSGKSAAAMAVDRTAAGVRRGVRIGAPARRRTARPVRQGDVADPREGDRHGVPGPDVGADPGVHGRRPDRRGHPDPPAGHHPTRGTGPRRRAARPRRHRPARTAGRALSARALRRRAPARRHRDRDRQRPRPADLRRADHGARRDRAGADPRGAQDSPRRHRCRRPDHHPRPRRRRRVRRPRAGHVRRARRRGGRRRGALR